jgi:hypothetical protein
MNLLFIEEQFKRLKLQEDLITYRYEPRSSQFKTQRHVYYSDMKQDFMEEVNAYGFSPFIQSNKCY